MTRFWRTRNDAACVSAAAEIVRRPPVAVVVAHPDDEALWLSSAVAAADRIVFCFGDLFERPKKSAARRRAVAALPLTGVVNLALPESGSYRVVDGTRPMLTPAGVVIADAAARLRYEGNYAKLVAALRPALAGFRDIYTHNPWGEYGHPEHIQVHRAVAALQGELGYTIWFSNYADAASWPLALALGGQPCWMQRRILEPDRVMAHRLMRTYRRHGAWTWTWAHRWPAQETFYALPPAEVPGARHPLRGEWLLDVARLRWWPPPWHGPLQRLE